MESNSGQVIHAIQSRLKELLAEAPPDGAGGSDWRERVLQDVCGPLEDLSEKLVEQQQQISLLQQQKNNLEMSSQELVAENTRLRIRLAGHRKLETAVQQRAEEFRSLAEDSPDVIIRFDRELRHLYVNPELSQLSGLPVDAFLGKTVDEVQVYQPLQDDWHIWVSPLMQGKEMRLEIEFPLHGMTHWFDLRMVPEFDGMGEVETILVVARDITHYKAIENALRRSEERFRLAASLAGLTLYEQNEALVYTWYHSPEFQDDRENRALGKRDADLYPPETADMLEGLKRGVLNSGQGLHQEILINTFAGPRWQNVIFEPLSDAGGKITSLLACTGDITALENALAAAQASAEEASRRAHEAEEGRRLLETLMEYIPEGIIITNAEDLRLRSLSKYIAAIEKRQRSYLMGQTFKQFIQTWRLRHANTQALLRPNEYPDMRAINHGEIIQDEDFILDINDGRQINLLINAAPIRDAQGHIFASVVAARDITERKRTEANQIFLSDLGRELVTMLTTDEVFDGTGRRLGEYLGVDRCYISQDDLARREHTIHQDYANGLPSLAGTYPRMEQLGSIYERLNQGRALITADLMHDPLTAGEYELLFAPTQLLALAVVPMFDRSGNPTGNLIVGSKKPRVWRPDEIALIIGVADLAHLALERARLFENLQEFRSRFEVALRNAPITVFTTDRDLRITWIFNPRYGYTEANILNQTLETLGLGKAVEALLEMERSVLESGQGLRRELHIPLQEDMNSFDATVEPLREAQGGIVGLTVAIMENTDLRRMEAEALRSQTHIEIQRRLIAERELERTRIARDLHDGPLQDMIAATYALVDAMTINEKKARLEKMRAIQQMLLKQVQQLRRFCNDLRPPVLAPFGLEKTIRSHVDGLQSLYPELHITLELEHDGQRLPEELRMTLFRVYQELMNNVLRHASASAVTVRFQIADHQAILGMEDNGVGFATPVRWLENARTGHLGLMGIQERVQMVGGRVDIRSMPGQGTRVVVTLPVG